MNRHTQLPRSTMIRGKQKDLNCVLQENTGKQNMLSVEVSLVYGTCKTALGMTSAKTALDMTVEAKLIYVVDFCFCLHCSSHRFLFLMLSLM